MRSYSGKLREEQIVIWMRFEWSHECIQMSGLRQILHNTENTGSFCSGQPRVRCHVILSHTSTIVILNVDTVYYMGFTVWNCEKHIGFTGVWLACLTSTWYLLKSSTSHLSKYIESSSVTVFPPLRQPKRCSSCPITIKDGGNFLSHAVVKFRMAVIKTHTDLWSGDPELWHHV